MNTRVLRSGVLTISLLFIGIGVSALVVTLRNWTMLSQDPEFMPAWLAAQNAERQPWLNFAAPLIPLALVGLILLPFSIPWEMLSSIRASAPRRQSKDGSSTDSPIQTL